MNNFYISQIISIFTIILTILGLCQKEKFKTLLCFTLCNITMMTTYFLLNRLLSVILVVVATIRTLIYFIFALKNIKPNAFIFIFFEIIYVAISVFLWHDYIDLLMLTNFCIVTYTTWQDDMKILRIGYIISAILLTIYDVLVFAYVNAISEIILLISSVVTYIHYNIKNKIDNIVLAFYQAIAPMFDINICNEENCFCIFSKTIVDSYNNFILIDNVKKLKINKQKLNRYFKKYGMSQIIYLPTQNNDNIEYIMDLSRKNELLFHDVWMKLRTGYNPYIKKCLLKNVEFKQCNDKNKKDIIKVFDKGFVHQVGDSIYKFSNQYIEIYEKNIFYNFTEHFNVRPYMAFYKEKPIALAFVYRKGTNAFICEVTTLQKYRNKGVASRLIKFIISSERKLGIEEFYLVTEKYTWLETFYMKNGFEPFYEGYCIKLNKKSKK